jgi:hypothetical protein
MIQARFPIILKFFENTTKNFGHGDSDQASKPNRLINKPYSAPRMLVADAKLREIRTNLP